MRRLVGFLMAALVGTALAGCSSEPLAAEGAAGSSNTPSGPHMNSGCSAALRQSLSLVDEVSTAAVNILSDDAGDRTLYIDASVGGLDGQDTHPWVYLSLKTGQAVAVTDVSEFSSTAWDLAFKRTVIRSNSGDSGPGNGGAIRIALAWEKVTRSTLGQKSLPTELWFDADCMIAKDATNNLITSFSDWSQYDEANHIVSAAPDVVYITAAAADGTLYKVQVEDYYSTPSGTHGSVAGRYKLRTAPLL